MSLFGRATGGWGWVRDAAPPLLAAALLALPVATLLGGVRSAAAEAGAGAPPGSTTYTLQEGDRLVSLAKQHEVSVEAILAVNKLRHARDLKVGQAIVIPPKGWASTRAGKARVEAAKRASGTYTVRSGDTLAELATRFGLDQETLLAANGMSDARELQAGQEIVIPGEGAPPTKRGAKAASPAEPRPSKREAPWMKRARTLAERVGLGTREVASTLLYARPERRWVAAAGGPRPPPTLRFPVTGGVAGRGWGSGTGGYHRALDIPGPIGTRVSAAGRGIVAYAGDELAGFGKVVIVLHPGELVTLYAHNSELKTVAGEKVRPGSRIALLGSSGISRGPHVHFEVIYHGQLCDPLPLFRPTPRTGGGRPALKASALLTWPGSGGPPAGLRCGPRKRHPAYIGRPRGVRIPDEEQARILAGRGEDEEAPAPDPDLTDESPSEDGEEAPSAGGGTDGTSGTE